MFAAVLEKGKSYKQTNELPYHVTMAALEPAEGKKGHVSVYVDTEEHEGTLLCTLKHNELLQVQLDLVFEEDSEVHFFIKGDGRVHLSGYVMPEDPMGAYDGFDEDNSEMDEGASDVSDVSGDEDLRQALNAKRKIDAEKAEQGGAKKAKLQNGEAAAKINGTKGDAKAKEEKVPKLKGADSDDEEDDSEDESMDESDMQDLMAKIKQVREAGAADESDESDDDEEESDEEEIKAAQSKLKEQLKKGGDKPGQTPKPKGQPQQSPQKGQQQGQKPKGQPSGQKGGQQKGSPGQQGGQNSGKKPWDKNKKTETTDSNSNVRQLKGNVTVEDVREGSGPVAAPGKLVHVSYIGRLSNNKEFDRSVQPFSFRLGKGEVIKGWDVGVAGMRVGGKRKIVVPPAMGYGNKRTGSIPAGSTLHFDVEIKSVS